MLELRPSCEHCQRALPPESTEAHICSFECTFCSDCVTRLGGSCPNCGGGFVPRPIRPARDWNGKGNFLGRHPARVEPKHRAVDFEAHAVLLRALADRPPHQR